MATTLFQNAVICMHFGFAVALPLLSIALVICLGFGLPHRNRALRSKLLGAGALIIIVSIFAAATAPYSALPGIAPLLLGSFFLVFNAISFAVLVLAMEQPQRINHDEREFHG